VEELGIRSFKFFMAYKGKDAVSILRGIDDAFLFEGFESIKKAGGMAIVHAENGDLIELFRDRMQGSQRNDLAVWTESRPNLFEEEATRRAVFLANAAGCPLCIAHMTIGEGVPFIAEQKSSGNPIFAETCPHYLVLTKERKLPEPSWGKVNPPLRGESDIQSLWRGLKDGAVDVIGTDHWSATKERKGKDIWSAYPGLTGIELALPVLLSEGVNKGRLSLEDVVKVSSFNPAKIFGLFPKKGLVEVGFDADLVLIDLEKEMTVSAERLHSHSDFSPYEGIRLKGWPDTTIVNGRILYQSGELMEVSHRGKYLRRQ